MPLPLIIITAVLGGIVGSFLNALLWRMRTGESVIVGRSYCPNCGHVLGILDLVPILSFAVLRGRCRYCKKGIHASYVTIEIACAALFTLFAAKAYAATPVLDPTALAWLLIDWCSVAALVAVFVYDLRYMLIPRRVTAVATVVAGAGGLLLGADPVRLALGMALGAGVFLLQYAWSRGAWIGGGDIHVGALMGAILGWPGVLVALFLSYVVGAAYAVVLVALGKKGWKSQIPFGTFLSAATVVAMLWGERILDWYLGLLM